MKKCRRFAGLDEYGDQICENGELCYCCTPEGELECDCPDAIPYEEENKMGDGTLKMTKITKHISLDKDVKNYYMELWHKLKLGSFSETVNMVLKSVMVHEKELLYLMRL